MEYLPISALSSFLEKRKWYQCGEVDGEKKKHLLLDHIEISMGCGRKPTPKPSLSIPSPNVPCIS